MRVEIKATTINQIVNADVIGLEQLAALSPRQKDELYANLIRAIESKSEELRAQPSGVSSDHMLKVAEAASGTMKALASPGNDANSRKEHLAKLFETFRTYFGEATDIVLTTVKLAQTFGLLSGGG
ncbi:MAG: hypothetical protein ABSD67_20570 [Terracidiphilus sp.]|jgi:hypothetical protein